MKIGLICPYSVAKGGGVQEIVYALRDQYSKNHDVRVITPRPKDYTGDPDHFIFIGKGSDISVRSLKTTGQVSSADRDEITEILTREKFDVLHFHEPWVPFLSAQILQINDRLPHRARTIATFHAKLPESISAKTLSQIVRPYTKPILRYIDTLTAVSPAASDYVRKLTDKPITIIPNGIDLKHFRRPTTFVDDGNTILYIGRLEARKGVKYLIRSFAKVVAKNPDARLILAGNGVDREKLEDIVRFDQVPNVEFLGYVSEAEKLKLLQTADVFCSPALYGESFGIVLLEAMACGAPIVAGNNSGYSAVMRNLGEISLVNPRHTDDFAHRLEIMMREPALRNIWREWAANEIPQYSYAKVAKLYEKLY